jgi:putative FmdB family regulatory protein
MPTYEYACSSCDTAWELEQSIKDDAITECPACHQATAKRQISRGVGFILKGGGWGADAYSGSSPKPPLASNPQGTTTTSITMDTASGATTQTVTKNMPDGSSESTTKSVPTPTNLPTPFSSSS